MGKSGEMLIDIKDRECGVIEVLEERIRQLKADNEALTNKLKYATSQNILLFVSNKEQNAEIKKLKIQNVDELCSGSVHVSNKFNEYMIKLTFCFFVVFIVLFAIIEFIG